MSAGKNRLTLEALAQNLETQAKRLETLERENEQVRSENAALRSKVDTLEESGALRNGSAETRSLVPHRDEKRMFGFEEPVSRRALLSKAGAAAVAAVAAGTLLNPRKARAHDGSAAIEPKSVYTHWVWGDNHATDGAAIRGDATSDAFGAVWGNNSGSGPGVAGVSNGTGPAVEGTANASGGTGVKGTGRYGVWGESNQAGFYGVFGRNTNTDGYGVRGTASDAGTGVRGTGGTGVWGSSSRTGYSGVTGQHTGSSGFGVVGEGKGANRAGVLGSNPSGTGVRGEGSTSEEVAGVRGLGKTGVWGSSAATGYSGVYGEHTGQGFGVVGDGRGSGRAGVLGRNSSGYGGVFQGGQAQLKLEPGSSNGHPTTGAHTKGELYMDSAARLWVCTGSATPGTWRRIQTVAVS